MGDSCCSGGGCGSGKKAEMPETPVKGGAIEFSGDEKPVLMTDAAVIAVLKAISEEGEPGDGLRVSVVGGGCSGYQYGLDFEKSPRMDDLTLQFNDLRVFVDPVSAGYLKGTTIDYVSGLNGTGFKFNNPNAKRTCGCGSSFS